MTMSSGGGALRCRACGWDVAPGALRCERCGAAQSDTTCPHCRATAGASPDAEFRYVCDVCGGPRIPIGAGGVRRSGSENGPLKVADAQRKSRAKWRGVAAVSGVLIPVALLVCGVVALIAGSAIPAIIMGALTAGPLAALLVFGLARSKGKGRQIQPQLDAAWIAAVTDVIAQSPRALSPRELGAALGIDEAKAEELLAMADVQGSIGGAQSLSMGGPPGQAGLPPHAPRTNEMASFDDRLRVATERAGERARVGDAELDAEAEAEAEAAAADASRKQSNVR